MKDDLTSTPTESRIVSKICMLTTTDNPYDPFDDYDNWSRFDEDNGYYSSSYLARIAITSDELSDEEQVTAIENAIDEIVNLNISGRYKKVTKFFT